MVCNLLGVETSFAELAELSAFKSSDRHHHGRTLYSGTKQETESGGR